MNPSLFQILCDEDLIVDVAREWSSQHREEGSPYWEQTSYLTQDDWIRDVKTVLAIALPEIVERMGPAILIQKRMLEAIQAKHKPVPNSRSALYPDPLCSCGSTWPCETAAVWEKEN